MGEGFRLLFVEDRDGDVALARLELERAGLEFSWYRVASESGLRHALTDYSPDIVLCDYTIPAYSGRAALDLVRLLCPSTPVLFVSGSMGEETASGSVEQGATDYLSKSNLRRLGPAVRRAILDARERERAREVEQSRQRLVAILETSSDMVVLSDAEGHLTFVNDAACRLLGVSRQQLLATDWKAIYAVQSSERMKHHAKRVAMRRGRWEGEVTLTPQGGPAIVTWQVVTSHGGAAGEAAYFATIGHDLRDRKDFEARIHRLAHYDTLTGLPNLACINDRVCYAIDRARRRGHRMALVTVNLDEFRLVDEGFGRALGDRLLKSVGSIMKAAVRERDAVARVGPDEFLVILSDLADPADATGLVQRILDAIAMPRSMAGQDVQITASAGVAVYPNDGDEFETLLSKANAAMHDVKARSRGRLQFHAGDLEQHARRRLYLEAGLRSAIEHHGLILDYQPQFEISGGRGCGVEALARWVRPDGEQVPPAVFIPLAEQTGLISTLGAWVLQEACSAVGAWSSPDDVPPNLCINVSAHQICKEFSDVVARVIESTGFPAERLELEITESALIADAALALACMGQWKGLGVRIALDDFGTGYSSLSYLSKLPVDRLKLDRSLVHNMTSEPKDAAIVRSVISLGQELGFAVIAEGVETEEQFQMLQGLGCQQVQGYLLARPAPAMRAQALLMSRWGARAAF